MVATTFNVAFESGVRPCYVVTLATAGDPGIGVAAAPGTSPAIAAMPCGNTDGIDQIAFQAIGYFWETTQEGAVDSQIAVMPNTSRPGQRIV